MAPPTPAPTWDFEVKAGMLMEGSGHPPLTRFLVKPTMEPPGFARTDWKIAGTLAGRVHVLASGDIIAVAEPAKTGEQWRLINR